MVGRELAQKILKEAIGYSQSDEILVSLVGGKTSLTRFANNEDDFRKALRFDRVGGGPLHSNPNPPITKSRMSWLSNVSRLKVLILRPLRNRTIPGNSLILYALATVSSSVASTLTSLKLSLCFLSKALRT